MKHVITRPTESTNPCAACKLLYGSTCCESKPGDGASFPRTFGEGQRLARWTGKPLLEALHLRKVPPDEVSALDGIVGFPSSQLIVDGYGLYLPENEDGSCAYLGPHGCTVPVVKPATCALFPFSRGPHGGWRLGALVESHGFCFAQDASAGDVGGAMKMFGVSAASLDTIERLWKRDLRTHAMHMRHVLRKRQQWSGSEKPIASSLSTR